MCVYICATQRRWLQMVDGYFQQRNHSEADCLMADGSEMVLLVAPKAVETGDWRLENRQLDRE